MRIWKDKVEWQIMLKSPDPKMLKIFYDNLSGSLIEKNIYKKMLKKKF